MWVFLFTIFDIEAVYHNYILYEYFILREHIVNMKLSKQMNKIWTFLQRNEAQIIECNMYNAIIPSILRMASYEEILVAFVITLHKT